MQKDLLALKKTSGKGTVTAALAQFLKNYV